jgi:hypothetical protein
MAWMLVSGHAVASDIDGDFAHWVSDTIAKNGLTNVVQDPPDPAKSLQGNNFNQMLVGGYSADRQTDQGTIQLTWIDLFNPSTQLDGFIDVAADSPGALKAAVPDVNAMIGSML